MNESPANNTLLDRSNVGPRYPPNVQDRETLDEVNMWFQSFMIPIGVIGNGLCLLVMTQKQNRSISCNVYMSALSITDSLVLLANGLKLLLIRGVLGKIPETGRALCRAIDYLFHGSAHIGVMIILALLVERVIVVLRPMRAAILLSPKRAYVIIGVMLLPTAAYSVPRLFFTSARITPQGIKCGEFAGKSASFTPYMIANLIIPGLAPLVAMSVMNILIVAGIKSARYQRYLVDDGTMGDGSNSNSMEMGSSATSTSLATSVVSSDSGPASASAISMQQDKDHDKDHDKPLDKPQDKPQTRHKNKQLIRRKRRERQLTIMTICMTSVFILCTLPSYVHDLAFMKFDPTSPRSIRLAYIWSEMLTQNLMALNSAINFLIYAVSGSRFRQDVVALCNRKT